MPAAASSRQPGVPIRPRKAETEWLLAEERAWLSTQLASRPSRPWLWLAPPASLPRDWPLPPPRGVLLCAQGDGYTGTFRCGPSLPLANECLGDVVLQHPDRDAGELLAECARVLVEGGRLWLFTLNPWSPYRLRTAGDLQAIAPGTWQQHLRPLGLHVDAPQHIGPCWRVGHRSGGAGFAPLRAGCVLVAEKRGLAPVAPAPVAWRAGAAPAA